MLEHPDVTDAPPRAMGHATLPPVPRDADQMHIIAAMLDGRVVDAAVQARYFAAEAVAARAATAKARQADDWPDLARYRDANRAAGRPDLIMIGDSLTEIWALAMPELFGDRIVNRGIAGQTSAQIMLRFMADVVDLAPARVHILCGTNDVAGNGGPTTPDDYRRNIRAMVDLATANGIAVLLATIPPAAAIFWSPEARPLEWIPHLNGWLRDFAQVRALEIVDYHAVLDDGAGGLRPGYSADGVHVTREAYRAMAAILTPML